MTAWRRWTAAAKSSEPHRVHLGVSIAVIASIAALVVALTGVIVVTSSPELPPRPYPTMIPEPVSGVNQQLQAQAAANPQSPIALTGLAYQGMADVRVTHTPCSSSGRWSLQVNPQDIVGYPYTNQPSAQDWERAAQAINTASSICLAPVLITWWGHYPASPSSDRWTALLPASRASGIDSTTLRRYALQHARQM